MPALRLSQLIGLGLILEGVVVASESVSFHLKSKSLCHSLFWAVYQLDIGVSIKARKFSDNFGVGFEHAGP